MQALSRDAIMRIVSNAGMRDHLRLNVSENGKRREKQKEKRGNTMSECTHDCSTCGENCGERAPESLQKPMNQYSNVKKVIAVISGKGGVGKSMVTSLLALAMKKRQYATAILDADVTGPSIPQMFHVHGNAEGDDLGIQPRESMDGMKIMSINLLLAKEDDPVVWRGPVIAGAVEQFWTDVVWGEVDYMFVDMPPGTGDVPLTVFQSLPIDGIIVVTSPQELVGMIVGKAVKMANLMNIPVLGIVENMAYFECPDCKEKHYIFGESHVETVAKKYNIEHTAQLPMDQELSRLADAGRIEECKGDWLKGLADLIEQM